MRIFPFFELSPCTGLASWQPGFPSQAARFCKILLLPIGMIKHEESATSIKHDKFLPTLLKKKTTPA